MKKHILIGIFLFFLCVLFVNAQIVRLSNSQGNTIINGVIFDSKTKDKIPFAHVVDVNKGTGTISNGLGVFRIIVSRFPAVLEFSHLSYKKKRISFMDEKSLEDNLTDSVLNVYLDQQSVKIDEVVIEGPFKKLLDEEPFHIFDFQFYEDNILLLGHRNNNFLKPELIITNLNGDVLSTKKLKPGKKLLLSLGVSTDQYQQIETGLFKDCFGNIHYITNDSVFQIYYDGKSLQKLFAIDHLNFEEYLLPAKIAIDNTLFCEDISENKQTISYYIISQNDKEKKLLRNIGKTEWEIIIIAIKKFLRDLYHYPLYPISKELYENDPTKEAIYIKDDNNNFVYDKYGNRALDAVALAIMDTIIDLGYYDQIHVLEIRRQLIFKPVYSRLLNINEDVFLLNFRDNKIELFNKYGQFTSEVPINFHKDKNWQKQIIFDDVTNKVYNLFMKKNLRLYLKEIDLRTGLPIRTINIPELKNIEKIKIRDNTLYFLYQPITGYVKKKLYSMNL